MDGKLRIRVISHPHWLYGRAFSLERRRRVFHIFPPFYRFVWEPIPDCIPFRSEADAKAWAENYAKGSWVSDSAVFDDPYATKTPDTDTK